MTFGTHNNNTAPRTHHGALDGAAVGGVAGHEGHHGHTARDAAIGGIGGHVAESHHERHMHDVNQHSHHHGGGQHTVTTTTTINKPTLGDKIAGTAEVFAGKIGDNPNKVAAGEIRKTEGKAAAQGASGGAYGGGTGMGRNNGAY